MPVPLFANRPERCPFGHSLAKGTPQRVGWQPRLCTPARDGAELGLGVGHLWVLCVSCHEEGREAMFYEPPHDVTHREPGPSPGPRYTLQWCFCI